MQWVIDKKQQHKSDKRVESEFDHHCGKGGEFDSDDEPDWMRNFVVNKDNQGQDKNIKKNKTWVGIRKSNFGRNRHTSCGDLLRKDLEEDCCSKKERKNLSNDVVELSDGDFLLEEYESEEERALGDGKSKRKNLGVSLSSSSEDEEGKDDSKNEGEEEEKLKVYFCSRTHSQLSQFIKELRKTVFANDMKVVCLGSRKNFCINEGMTIYHRMCKCVQIEFHI